MVEATEEWIARNKGEAYQSRRRLPSFSSALLEAISRSTESTQEQRSRTRLEMEKKYHYRDSTLGRPKEAHAKRGSEEILIFQARKYFNGSYESRDPRGGGPHYSLEEEDEEDEDAKEDGEKEHFAFKLDSCSDTSTVKGLRTPTWPFYKAESPHSRRGSRPFRKSADEYVVDRRNGSASPAMGGGHFSDRSSSTTSQGVAMKELLMKKEKPQPKPKETTTDAKKQRPKQPMSPGSKLASFLNSLFTPTSTKRNSQRVDPRVPKSDEGSTYSAKSRIKKEKEASHSVCSRSSSTKSMSTTPSVASVASVAAVASVASVSKSSYLCDIYKPKSKSDDRGGYNRYDSSSFQNTKLKSSCVSSAKKENNGKNGRSVTFHPTSLILDENARPCGEKDLNRVENPKKYNHPSSLMMARKLRLQLLDKGVIPSEYLLHGKHSSHNKVGDSRVFEEEDDAASDSSSDLFELENFNAMDMNIYSRDLPVYETTHLETNKAIAKGLL